MLGQRPMVPMDPISSFWKLLRNKFHCNQGVYFKVQNVFKDLALEPNPMHIHSEASESHYSKWGLLPGKCG